MEWRLVFKNLNRNARAEGRGGGITSEPSCFPLDWRSHCTLALYSLQSDCNDHLFAVVDVGLLLLLTMIFSCHSNWPMALHSGWTHHSCAVIDHDSVVFLLSLWIPIIRLIVVLMHALEIQKNKVDLIRKLETVQENDQNSASSWDEQRYTMMKLNGMARETCRKHFVTKYSIRVDQRSSAQFSIIWRTMLEFRHNKRTIGKNPNTRNKAKFKMYTNKPQTRSHIQNAI